MRRLDVSHGPEKRYLHGCAAWNVGQDTEAASNRLGTFTHPGNAPVAVTSGLLRLPVKTSSVITYAHEEVRGLVQDVEANVSGTGVLNGICHRLSGDLFHLKLHQRAKINMRTSAMDTGFHARRQLHLAESEHQPAFQGVRRYQGRAQLVHGPAALLGNLAQPL